MNAKGLSIGAMVCGILGIVFSWIPFVVYIAFPLAVVGIILAGIAMSRINKGGEGSKGMAVAGLVCGIVGAALGLPMLICTIYTCAAAGEMVNAANRFGNLYY